MDEGQRAGGAAVSADDRTPDEIRHDIEQTREQLAQTAAALAEKADVKARAHDKLEETKARITGKVHAAKNGAADAAPASVSQGAQSVGDVVKRNPVPVAVLAGFAAGALVGRLLAHRR